MNFQRGDMFYDNPHPHSHSPNSQRMPSSGGLYFNLNLPCTFANNIEGFYPQDDPSARFDVPRFNDRMAAATLHAGYGGYDLGGAQTWNSGAFGGNTLGGLGTNRMKSSARGRSALPSVCLLPIMQKKSAKIATDTSSRDGLINLNPCTASPHFLVSGAILAWAHRLFEQIL